MKSLALLLLLLSASLEAAPRANHLSLQLSRMPFNYDPFFPDRTNWGHELQLRWDVSWGRWFMDNNLTGRTYNSRFRYVGWEYETGFNLLPGVDVIWHHHSQHAMDLERDRFPVMDSYGVRFTFLEKM